MRSKILYIYGAGGAGIKFKNNYYEMICQYDAVYFVDQDKGKISTAIDGIVVLSPEDVRCGDMVISNYGFGSVYSKFWNMGSVKILGIYIQEKDTICDYKSACFMRKATFYNESALRYMSDANTIIELNLRKYRDGGNLYSSVGAIYFELSNICNYADIHKKCPVSREKEKIIMPMKQINEIIDEIALEDYSGEIGFYIYNEPLIDPRLFLIMDIIKKKVPKCRITITTNAFYFNQVILNELFEYGCDRLTVSAYGDKEFDRLLSYEINAPYVVYYSRFDDRLDQYSESATAIKSERCSSFVNFVGISCTGELYLCCMDYERRFKLGNVFERGLKEILSDEKITYYTDNLIDGNRNVCNLCKNCSMEF